MTNPSLKNARLLLVEDDITVHCVIETALADEGISIVFLPEGREALRIACDGDFDIILLDLGLPDTGGFQLLQQLRASDRCQHIPILILTAWNNPEDKVQGFEYGASDYITKPFEIKELRARVRSALRNKFLQEELTRANEALEKARNAAENTTRAKSNFLAQMSHEIRTPMNGVIAMSRLLLEGELGTEQRDLAQTIHSSASSLLQIINDILDFSKIEAGKLELEHLEFEVNTCVTEAIDILSVKANEKGLELSCHIEDSVPPRVLGDMGRIRQVLLNLLSNGVKFTNKGEVFVQVSGSRTLVTDTQETKSCSLHFSVRDTGVGIASDRFSRLFQPFSQADASTSREFGGTGLGLVISKSLVELMSGKMWVESVVGKGSTFHFTIMVQPGTTPPPGTPASLGGTRMLIVDDNVTNRRILTLQARKWGMEPVDVSSGTEAIEAFSRARFDFAIVDMQMPGMDGLTLASQLRQRFPAHKTQLILLTSVGLSTDASSEQVRQFQACLNKPVKPAQLHDVLLRAKPKSARAPQSAQAPRLNNQLAQKYPLQLLLVDDNLINQKVGLRLLQQMGYQAAIASNGQEALDALQRQKYDMVFMDVQMPGMDGLEATLCIRELEKHELISPSIIVAMTANAMQGDREKCIASGMNDYIAKPVNPELLQQLLERWGEKIIASKPVAPAATPATPPQPAVTARPGVASTLPVPGMGPAPVDLKRLKMFSDGTSEGLRELIALYLDQTQKQFEEMDLAVKEHSAERIRKVAHSGAGSSSTCGMNSLGLILREIERLATENNLETIDKLFNAAREEFTRVQEVLDKELAAL